MTKNIKPTIDKAAPTLPDLDCGTAGSQQNKGEEITPDTRSASQLSPIAIAPGSIIANHYEVLSVLGSGGMGVVLKAKDRALNRLVAMKLLQRQNERALARFHTEARAIGSLNHPNIVRVHQLGLTEQGHPFLIMDLVAGQTLGDLIEQTEGLSLAQAVPILSQICDALEHAHSKGIIHRDLKASNVMLSIENGQTVAQLVDFGIAKITSADDSEEQLKHTATGDMIGSPAYMSPEQIQKHDIDWRCDIYAMGCLIFECLTGNPPFAGATTFETFFHHLQTSPASIQISAKAELKRVAEIDAIILKCMAKQPKDRFQSAAEIKDALQALLKEKELPWHAACLQKAQVIILRTKAAKFKIPTWLYALAIMAFITSAAAGAYYFGVLNEPAERRWKVLWLDGQKEFNRAQYAKAREDFQQALLIAQSSLPLQKLVGPTVKELADISIATGNWRDYRLFKAKSDSIYADENADAKRLREKIEQALRQRSQFKSTESAELCNRANDLASICIASGHANIARQLLEPTLKLSELHLPNTAQTYARSLHNLALTCNNLGDNESAERLYLKAIRSQQNAPSTQLNPEIGKDYIGIGRLRFQQKRFTESAQYFQEALHLYTMTFGPQSEQVAWVKVNMAEAFIAEGKNDLVLEQLKQSRALFETLERTDEQKRARCYTLFAFVTGKTEDLKAALELQQASLRREPYYLASLLTKLGMRGESNQQNSDQTIGYCTRAFVIAAENNLPARQIEDATLKALGTVCMSTNKISNLEPLYQFKLEMDKAKEATPSPVIAQDLLELGRFYMRAADAKSAESYFLAAQNEQEKLPTAMENTWRLADINGSLGQLYLDNSQPEKAKVFFGRMCQSIDAQKSLDTAPASLGGSLLRYCSYLENNGEAAKGNRLRLLWSKAATHIRAD